MNSCIKQPTITVFTPTYNRSELLVRLFNSLVNQTSHDFEWLIVDDGSSDQTTEVCAQFQTQHPPFSITYHKQTNSGKHIAINHGVHLANGSYFFIVDSDDWLPETSIQTALALLKDLPHDAAWLSAANQDPSGNQIGRSIGTHTCNYLDYYYALGGSGDRADIFRTEILKEFPFPHFEGERFCPEALVWHRISQHYRTHYVPDILYICEYQADGLSAQSLQVRRHSPTATTLYYHEISGSKLPFKYKLRMRINLWRFQALMPSAQRKHIPITWRWLDWIAFPIGRIMLLKDHIT